MVSKLLKPKFH